jgi:haloalkane dehalogenase
VKSLNQIADIPCLIIWGKDDKLIPMDHVKKFKDVLKEARVETLDNAGRSPHAEKLTITYEKIMTFLTKRQ